MHFSSIHFVLRYLRTARFACVTAVSVSVSGVLAGPGAAQEGDTTTAYLSDSQTERLSEPQGAAWPESPSLNFYGAPGLIDMPSAEMLPDGQFAPSVSYFSGQLRLNLQAQALPWLNVAFRYIGIENGNPNQLLFGFDTYYDRNFDVRVRLWKEGPFRPAVTVGLQDFAGTGLFGSEYIVGTKNFDPHFLPGRLKVSAGLGWGRFGSSGAIGSYGERGRFVGGDTGGELSTDQWFRGDFAPFGGIEWIHGKWGVKAEYSTDAYTLETGSAQVFERQSRLNFGVEYQASRQLRLGAYYLYGSEFGVTAQLQLNPRHPATRQRIAAPAPVVPRSQWTTQAGHWDQDWAQSQSAKTTLRDKLAAAFRQDGLVLEAVHLEGTSAQLLYRNTRYQAEPLAIGRIARAMAQVLPPSVETFHIQPTRAGQGVAQITIRRSDLEALEFAPDAADQLWAVAAIQNAAPLPQDALISDELYPAFSTSISPYTAPSYFDPSLPFRLDIGLDLNGSYTPAPGWRVAGRLRHRVWGNVAQGRESNSRLPRVRTNQSQFAAFGTTLNQLYAEKRWQPAPNFYARGSVGYFESMFGGVSGELLWKPVDSRLGLGIEANYVQQREFDQRLGFQDYGVLTGHASAYLELPKNYLMQVDAGRYLAGDYGATFSLFRTFNNGWVLGGFFTLTNVSAEDFGEGSFDKGLRLRIPLGWLAGTPSRNAYGLVLRPIQRDGGQRVFVPGRLYDAIRTVHKKSLQEQRARFWE